MFLNAKTIMERNIMIIAIYCFTSFKMVLRSIAHTTMWNSLKRCLIFRLGSNSLNLPWTEGPTVQDHILGHCCN